MNWFNGTISEAIMTAKNRKAIFVVYVEGSDESSHIMNDILNCDDVTNKLSGGNFVSIKLPSNDIGYKQFVEIYKLVPIPSVFFIGNNGVPIDIVAADQSSSSLLNKIKEAITKCDAGAKAENEQACTSSSVSPSMASQPTDSSANNTASGSSLEERVDEVRQLIEQKKEEREIKEFQDDKNVEINRRKVGQELQKARALQQEREMKEILAEREKEKKESLAAKQRVLEQIAQDRAERSKHLKEPAAPVPEAAPVSSPTSPPQIPGNVARIQFKMPTGESKIQNFTAETTLGEIRQFIDNNIVLTFREYRLASTFPRREFTDEDNDLDLRNLNLLPSAVILILPVTGAELRPYTRSMVGLVSDLVMGFLQPFFSLTSYIQGLVFGAGPRQGNSASGSNTDSVTPPSSSAPPDVSPAQDVPKTLKPSTFIKKSGNIHSLRDHREESDENNTWNGNSTQQM